MTRTPFLLLVLVGCGSTVVVDGDGDEGGGGFGASGLGGAGVGLGGSGGVGAIAGPGGAGGDGGSIVGGNGGSGGGGETGTFDCALAPSTALSTKIVPGARGYHGLAINDIGLMYGTDVNGNLIRSTYDGAWTPFLSNLFVDQIAFAENGNLHMASSNTVLTATPAAQLLTLNGQQQYTYGLRMGPDGKVWIADSSSIRRLHPVSGAAETVTTLPDGGNAHSFDFNRAFDRLYIGTIGDLGHIRFVDLDVNYNAVGQPQTFVNLMGFGSVWLDGIATDVCGNLYVPNFTTSQLFKVTPTGTPTVYVDWSSDSSKYGHGVIFGNGLFGFREDALYLPMPYNYNTVMEVVVGIPGREFAGTVINGPTP